MSALIKPIARLSRRIQSAPERDPGFNAMFTPGRAIPNTWGNLASQLMELDLVDPTAEAAAAFIGIDTSDLKNTELQFTTRGEVDGFKGNFIAHHATIFRSEQLGPVKAFGAYMQAEVEERKKAPDEATLAEIAEESETLIQLAQNAPNRQEYNRIASRNALLNLAYKAHQSWVAFTLPEFVAVVMNYEDESGFTRQERAHALSKMISWDILSRHPIDPATPAGEILIGNDLHNSFARDLGVVVSKRAKAYGVGKWESLRPLLIAPSYDEHPHFAKPLQAT